MQTAYTEFHPNLSVKGQTEIYVMKQGLTFTAPIFVKIADAEGHYAEIVSAIFHTYRSRNVQIMSPHVFTALTKYGLQ
jgi:hypothetical protein